MKSNKKNSLNTKIWLYLAIFSLLILLFLWIFQIIFLSSYYEWHKTKDIKQLVKQVVTNYNTNDTDDFYNNLEKISFENGVCIELTDKNNTIPYSNNGINRETDVGDVSFLIEDRDRVKSVVAVGFLQETSKLWSSR